MPQLFRAALWCLALLPLAPGRGGNVRTPVRHAAQPHARAIPVAPDSSALVRRFVQGFYNDYTPLAHRPDPFPAYYHVLGRARPVLSATLAAALRADSAARRDSATVREVLDFDPFLNSQDPCTAYQAGAARRVRGGFRVAVRPRCADLRGQQDPVVVTVAVEQGTLRIANVAGPTMDLLRLLCVYAARGTLDAGVPARCR